jgi:poly-beta-1,6-N-acetyl-D-glucosamine synthase
VKDLLFYFPVEELILWGLLLLFFIIQMTYYLVVYIKVASRKQIISVSQKMEPVSIVICARNEAENLEAHLPVILEQDYPDYEVIIVDDCSHDDTEDVLKRFKHIYPHLKTTTIKEDEKFIHGKKLALTIGIKATKNEWILFTDADCMPENRQWISTMQSHFTEDTQIVLGYGGYKSRNGFLNKLIRFDTFFIALQYLGFAMCRKPYMGVGRNLAYRKSLFLKNKGFASHHHLPSGDDDLFVNEVAKGKTTDVEFFPDAHTRSNPKDSFSSWSIQKKRHLSTSKYYKLSHKYLLTVEPLSRVLFWFLVIALCIVSPYWYASLGIFFIRLIVQQVIFYSAMKRLNEKQLLPMSIIFDVILPFINLNLYIANSFTTKKNKWK